jgi:dihydroxyacetone kinase
MSLIAHVVLASSLASRVKLIIGPAALMTALNMNGFSLSLIRLDESRVKALEAAAAPRAWVPATRKHEISVIAAPRAAANVSSAASGNRHTEALLTKICTFLIGQEAELNRLDARAGDGDTGSTVATGARAIQARLGELPLADTPATLSAIGSILSTSMGGSSGVLLSIFFTAAGKALQEKADLASALLAGLERMIFYGGATPGARTMVDALDPGLKALASEGLIAAAKAARNGAEATKAMTKAKAGRASYVSESNLAGVADPGAVAVAGVFEVAAGLG